MSSVTTPFEVTGVGLTQQTGPADTVHAAGRSKGVTTGTVHVGRVVPSTYPSVTVTIKLILLATLANCTTADRLTVPAEASIKVRALTGYACAIPTFGSLPSTETYLITENYLGAYAAVGIPEGGCTHAGTPTIAYNEKDPSPAMPDNISEARLGRSPIKERSGGFGAC